MTTNHSGVSQNQDKRNTLWTWLICGLVLIGIVLFFTNLASDKPFFFTESWMAFEQAINNFFNQFTHGNWRW